jgi:hypothetical protein
MDREQREANQYLRTKALATREKNRRIRRLEGKRGPGVYPRPVRTPEHFHIAYHLPSDNIVIPYFAEVFATQKDAYSRVKDLGDEAEPETEWYENGLVGIETPIHGRSGLWWVVLEVTRCVRSGCRPYLPRDLKLRQMVVLPDAEPVAVHGDSIITSV